MKNKASIKSKVYRKIHWFIIVKLNRTNWVISFYPAYLHGKKYAKRNKKKINEAVNDKDYFSDVYMTQIPNEGAGIGHQISNYNAGLHFSQLFNAKYVYSPFVNEEWDQFLGFGEGEKKLADLKKEGYKIHRLPYFGDEDYGMIKNIVDSYSGEKVILRTELDQFYQKQYETIDYIKNKFENAKARKNDKLIFNESETNIAIHIRRGDINIGQENGDKALTKRWLDTDYYLKVMEYIKNEIKCEKPLHLYIFSQDKEDYSAFEKYGKVTICVDMSAKDSFLHMVRADILVISKSSFSYKPALLADGIRICPKDFWHGYPNTEKWIVMQ